MCNCVEILEKNILEKVKDSAQYKKPVESVKICGTVFSFSDNMKLRYTTDFRIKLIGQKKEPTISVQNSHCQFCGEKYSD